MRECVKKLKRYIAFTVLFILVLTTPVFAESLDISAVSVNMPDFRVYLPAVDEEMDMELWQLYLNQKEVEIESVDVFNELDEGIEYYFLIDTSTSISDSYFNAMKKGLISYIKGMDEKDRITLVTFGRKVQTLCESKTNKKVPFSKIEKLGNTENQTKLFEAMTLVAQKANDGSDLRKVMVLLSDGEDVALGSNTKQEAVSTLRNAGISLYTLTYEDAVASYINSNGEMARKLGGRNYSVSQTSQSVVSSLQKIKNSLNNSIVIQAQADTNIIPKDFRVTLDFGIENFAPAQKKLSPTRYQKDMTNPEIVSVEREGKYQLKLVFSESVQGAGVLENYHVTINGKEVGLTGVSYSDKEFFALLRTKESVAGGEYRIEGNNIYDNSMEKNTLEPYAGEVSGEWFIFYLLKTFLAKYWWLAAVILIAIIIAAALWRIKKNQGFVTVDGQVAYGKNVKQKYHFKTKFEENETQKVVELLISNDGKHKTSLEYGIDGSVILGRSKICEISFDDPNMSRQHFVIEVNGGSLYISDLGTVNGTILNGLKITSKRKLCSGDTITAGKTMIKVRWTDA